MSHHLRTRIDLSQFAGYGDIVRARGEHIVEDEEHARRFMLAPTGCIETQRGIEIIRRGALRAFMAGSVDTAKTQTISDIQGNACVMRKLLERGQHPSIVHRVVACLGGRDRNQGQAVVLMYFSPPPEARKSLCDLLDGLLLVLPVRSALAVEAFS